MKKGAILVNILLFVFTSIGISEVRIEKTYTDTSPVISSESSDKQSSEKDNSLLVLEESEEESESRVRLYPLQMTTNITEETLSVIMSSAPDFIKLYKQNYHIEIPLSLRAPPTVINFPT